jgi:hypothetical protein
LIQGTPELAIARPQFALNIRLLLGAKRRCPMGAAGLRFAHMKRTLRLRAVFISVLEELPFICPVAVAIGSLIMIGITLCKDWPQ